MTDKLSMILARYKLTLQKSAPVGTTATLLQFDTVNGDCPTLILAKADSFQVFCKNSSLEHILKMEMGVK